MPIANNARYEPPNSCIMLPGPVGIKGITLRSSSSSCACSRSVKSSICGGGTRQGVLSLERGALSSRRAKRPFNPLSELISFNPFFQVGKTRFQVLNLAHSQRMLYPDLRRPQPDGPVTLFILHRVQHKRHGGRQPGPERIECFVKLLAATRLKFSEQ